MGEQAGSRARDRPGDHEGLEHVRPVSGHALGGVPKASGRRGRDVDYPPPRRGCCGPRAGQRDQRGRQARLSCGLRGRYRHRNAARTRRRRAALAADQDGGGAMSARTSCTRAPACAAALLLLGYELLSVVRDPRTTSGVTFYFPSDAASAMREYYQARQTVEAERSRVLVAQGREPVAPESVRALPAAPTAVSPAPVPASEDPHREEASAARTADHDAAARSHYPVHAE